jgi:hypothetical protein
MTVRHFFPFVEMVALVCSVGCSRPKMDPHQVDGRNFGAFYYWRSSVSSSFSPEGWREFNAAVEELRLQAMARGVRGKDAIDQALCDAINGRSVTEVLRLGDEAKIARLSPIRDTLKVMVDANALIAAVPGSDDLAEVLERKRSNQQAQLRATVAELDAAQQAYRHHGGTPAGQTATEVKPARLSREEALHEFDLLILARRQLACLKYGDWPAKIDRDGRSLLDQERDAFLAKKGVAAANGHAVIPVFVRASWRIFDAPVVMPAFTDAVMGNLTPEDRRSISERWAESEAEIWARREASKETANTAIANIKSSLDGIMRP